MTKTSKSVSRKTKTRQPKKIVKTPTSASSVKTRKKPKYRSFRLQKRIKNIRPGLPSAWAIAKKAVRLMRANTKQIGWFVLTYGLLHATFVNGFSTAVNINEVQDVFSTFVEDEQTSALATNFTVFGLMLQSTVQAAGEVSGLYQTMLFIISMLAFIWLYRQHQAGNKVTMKQAFYRGMYPIIPFTLLTFVIALQSIPASIGNFLFSTVVSSGLIVSAAEQFAWTAFFLGTIILSVHLMVPSFIALFIVTLPEMTPMAAIRSAKELVVHRRINVLFKIMALAVFSLALYVGLVFPAIFISDVLAQIVFFGLTILIVPFITAYLFVLYRELL